MSNRREFLKGLASASAGALIAHCNCGLMWELKRRRTVQQSNTGQ